MNLAISHKKAQRQEADKKEERHVGQKNSSYWCRRTRPVRGPLLAQQGAKVTVFERSHVGAGTSSTTFAGLIQMAKHQKVIIISMPWRLTSISGYNRNGPQKVIG